MRTSKRKKETGSWRGFPMLQHIVEKYWPHKFLQDPACFYYHPVFIIEMNCTGKLNYKYSQTRSRTSDYIYFSKSQGLPIL